jgi:hypothetical protein
MAHTLSAVIPPRWRRRRRYSDRAAAMNEDIAFTLDPSPQEFKVGLLEGMDPSLSIVILGFFLLSFSLYLLPVLGVY